jgi:hypothetical protein
MKFRSSLCSQKERAAARQTSVAIASLGIENRPILAVRSSDAQKAVRE